MSYDHWLTTESEPFRSDVEIARHLFWRGDYIVKERRDGQADVYEWSDFDSSYVWAADFSTRSEAEEWVAQIERGEA